MVGGFGIDTLEAFGAIRSSLEVGLGRQPAKCTLQYPDMDRPSIEHRRLSISGISSLGSPGGIDCLFVLNEVHPKGRPSQRIQAPNATVSDDVTICRRLASVCLA